MFAGWRTGLPGLVIVLQAGTAVNYFGTGLILPFEIIYLHQARGFPTATAGLDGILACTVGALAEHLIAACAPVVVSDMPQVREELAAEPAPHCFDADEIGIRWRRTACTRSVCLVQAAPD